MRSLAAGALICSLVAASPAAADVWGGLFGGEEESAPQDHPWADGAAPASEEEIRALGVTAELAEMLRNRTGTGPGLFRGAAQETPIGLVWRVGPTASTRLVRDLREELARRGFAFFVSHRRFGTGPDEIALVRVEKPLDVLERVGAPGPKAGLSTADVARRLDEWARIAEWSLLGAGADWIEIDFDPVPTADVLGRILEEGSRLAPSAVPVDPSARDRLRATIAAERRLLLFWD